MKSKKAISSPAKAKIIHWSFRFFAWLPLEWNRKLGKLIGYVIWLSKGRSVKTSQTNIRACFPELSEQQVTQRCKESCIHSGMLMTEFAWIWLRPKAELMPYIHSVSGGDLVETAVKKGKGVIITGGHFGSWEIFMHWCTHYFSAAAIYRIPKIVEMDSIIRRAREKTGGKMIEADHRSVRQMLQVLKAGEVLIILSDQRPANNSGVFAPFFHRPAYTMTLLQRLIEKTQAELLFFACNRTTKGFAVEIKKPEFNYLTHDSLEFATALNAGLMAQINTAPEQYQWSYKRFKPQPEGYDRLY